MSLDRQLLLLFALLTLPAHSGAFFGWFTRKSSSRSPAAPKEANPDPQSLPNAPFEMTTADDKFLAEANQFELSPLDGCHYKVVSHLRSSCTEISEEEIAKLGVTLFNCQAEVEGRKTYPCTEEMTLAECTASMDPDTWNAYHIVSNRARSVCYATRQLHFRRRTELTVNTLVSTAMSQLEAMKMLKDGQEELKELTSESLQKVLGSQADLLSQQEQLQSNQEEMETSISGNLEMLAEEKALIASGHHLVAQMIEGIAQKMENVSGHLKEQDAEVQEGHKSILADLSEVRDRSQEVYSKIESNLALFLSYQNRSAQYFDVLMEKLQRMNQSLGTVLYAMDHMHRSVENRLSYIQAFINWAGGNLNAIYTCVLHGAYFLLLALMMTFLQTPGFSRAVLLVLIVVNALSELNHQTSLGFRALTALLVCTVIGHWTLLNCIRCLLKVKNRKVCPALPPPQPVPVAGSHTDKGARFSTPEKMGEETLLEKELRKLSDEGYTEDDSLFGHKSLVYDVSIIASPAPLDWKLQHCLRTPNQSTPAMKLRRLSITKAVQGHDSPLKPRSDYPQIRGWIPQLELDRWTLHVCWLMHSVSIPPARGTEKLRDLVHNSPLRYQVGQYNTSQRHLGAAFDAVSEPKNYSLNNSMSSNLSVSSMSPRQFCQAITRAGQPCRNKASGRQEFCRVHASGESSYTAS